MATPTNNPEFEAKKQKGKELIAAGGCYAICFWSRTDAERLLPKTHDKLPDLEPPVYTGEWIQAAKKAIELIQSGIDILELKS